MRGLFTNSKMLHVFLPLNKGETSSYSEYECIDHRSEHCKAEPGKSLEVISDYKISKFSERFEINVSK